MEFDSSNHPHRRYNPLTGEWLLVSPHRTKRPWQGKTETLPSISLSEYDKKCYLCPGNTRSNGTVNENYKGAYVFGNDFPALIDDIPKNRDFDNPLFEIESDKGTSRVICYSTNTNIVLPV